MDDDEPSTVEEILASKRLVPRDFALWELAILAAMAVFVWLPLLALAWTAEKLKSLGRGRTDS